MSHIDREWDLKSIAGLGVTVTPAAILGFGIVWLLAAWLTSELSVASAGLALLAGFSIAIIHFASEFLHQVGHAVAAWCTGYPMIGVRFGTFLLFATSLYPDNEPELPDRIHIRRALGGPAMSISIGLLAGLALWFLADTEGFGHLLIQFLCLDNLLLLGLGAFLPLGFTDGSTIYHYWRNP